ncbi:MAG: hypothetical protein KAH67_03875 [Flavobacteriaceae bacterium]|nr:hypothetical protein [Flavobacteriaceae bacterium]
MKDIVLIFVGIVFISFYGCNSTKSNLENNNKTITTNTVNDTIKISNEELEYEIIIIEIGFESWLVTQKPITYYSNNTFRIKNNFNVVEWNQRVLQPSLYDPILYEQLINYDPAIDYGIEVNYKLYMYFQYFQQKYHQKL